jgi:hypothetical protein
MFESLAQKRLDNTWTNLSAKDQSGSFKSSLKRRAKDEVRVHVLELFPDL